MQIRWSSSAARDLTSIIRYIHKDNPAAANRVAEIIFANTLSLSEFPEKGRRGRVEGTRELPLPSLPYVVVYRIAQDAVEIANVIHGSQRWPPQT